MDSWHDILDIMQPIPKPSATAGATNYLVLSIPLFYYTTLVILDIVISSLSEVEVFVLLLMTGSVTGPIIFLLPYILPGIGLIAGIVLILLGKKSETFFKTGIIFLVGFFLLVGYFFAPNMRSFTQGLLEVLLAITFYISAAGIFYNIAINKKENRKQNLLLSFCVFILSAIVFAI